MCQDHSSATVSLKAEVVEGEGLDALWGSSFFLLEISSGLFFLKLFKEINEFVVFVANNLINC